MTVQPGPPAVAEALVVHAKSLCETRDHLWDILADLSIPDEPLSDNREQGKVAYETDSLIRAVLYREIRGFSENRLASELARSTALVKAFGMESAPRQQTINDAWKQFGPKTKQMVEAAAEGIGGVCVENDVIRESLVPSFGDEENTAAAPDEATTPDREYVKRKAKKSVRLARKHATPAFDTNRAENKTYSDQELLDMFFRTAATDGSASEEGEVGWLLDDDHTCHGSTMLRAIKKFATPAEEDAQLHLDDFGGSQDESSPSVEQIRDELMGAFDTATERIRDTIQGENIFGDRRTVAAIDITYERFWPSPWEDRDAEIVKDEYPEMVSGYATNDGDATARGFKYATLTLVGDTAPIILAIEPVKEKSAWEEEGASSFTKGEVVARLLNRAQSVADIDEVYMDREFYTIETLKAVTERDMLYTVPVPRYASDLANIQDIKEHPEADAAVLHDAEVGGRSCEHSPEFCYVPTDRADTDGRYAIFATNRDHVDPDEIQSVTNGYRRRWDIENQYKTVKRFKPRTSSSDYRIRLAGFTLAALLYNLWRLVDVLLKIARDKPVRSPPEIQAHVFARVIGQYLRRVT